MRAVTTDVAVGRDHAKRAIGTWSDVHHHGLSWQVPRRDPRVTSFDCGGPKPLVVGVRSTVLRELSAMKGT